jgi:hypothetical protein
MNLSGDRIARTSCQLGEALPLGAWIAVDQVAEDRVR